MIACHFQSLGILTDFEDREASWRRQCWCRIEASVTWLPVTIHSDMDEMAELNSVSFKTKFKCYIKT